MDANLVKRNENGQSVTNSLLVAQKFEKQHKDVLEAVRGLLQTADNQAAENSATCKSMFYESFYVDANGFNQPMFIMNRDGFSLLAMGFTGKKALSFKLEFIKEFNKLEQQARIDTSISTADVAIKLVESASRTLNLNDNSKLLMYRRTAETYSINPKIFPDYTTSNGVLVPLTTILEGTGINTRNANLVLESLGIIEKKYRKSSKGKEKSFWNINANYSRLGENQTSPQNPKETQPLWYEARKDEIVNLIRANLDIKRSA